MTLPIKAGVHGKSVVQRHLRRKCCQMRSVKYSLKFFENFQFSAKIFKIFEIKYTIKPVMSFPSYGVTNGNRDSLLYIQITKTFLGLSIFMFLQLLLVNLSLFYVHYTKLLKTVNSRFRARN